MRDWVFFLVGVLLTLLGIWLTIYLRPGRRLNVFIQTVHLTDRKMVPDPEIAITFRDTRVIEIVVHEVYVWNSGNVSIRNSDVVPESPLSVSFAESSLVSVRDVEKVGQTFQLSTIDENGKVAIYLNHLDVAQGFYLMIYEGVTSEETYLEPTFNGYILDSRGIKGGVEPDSPLRAAIKNSDQIIFVIPILIIIVAYIITFPVDDPVHSWGGIVTGRSQGSDALTLALFNPRIQLGLMSIAALMPLVRPLLRMLTALRHRVPTFSQRVR